MASIWSITKTCTQTGNALESLFYFNSIEFIVFLPIVFLSYWFVFNKKQDSKPLYHRSIPPLLCNNMKIIFDFGTSQSYNAWGDLRSRLKFVDEQGKEIEFNSMVDAANYMVDKGWSFQQAYSSTYGGSPVIHWIFYKDAESFDKAREGIMTKEDYRRLRSHPNP